MVGAFASGIADEGMDDLAVVNEEDKRSVAVCGAIRFELGSLGLSVIRATDHLTPVFDQAQGFLGLARHLEKVGRSFGECFRFQFRLARKNDDGNVFGLRSVRVGLTEFEP